MPLPAPGNLLRLEAKADSSPAGPFPLFFFAAVSAFQSSCLCQGLYFGICGNRLVWANGKLQKSQGASSSGPPRLLRGQERLGAAVPGLSVPDMCPLGPGCPFPGTPQRLCRSQAAAGPQWGCRPGAGCRETDTEFLPHPQPLSTKRQVAGGSRREPSSDGGAQGHGLGSCASVSTHRWACRFVCVSR